MSVFLKWEEPKEFTKKKHKENARLALKLTWGKLVAGLFFGGFFMLTWYLATILPQEDTGNSPAPFWIALLFSIGLFLLIVIAAPWLNAKSSPSTIRIKTTEKGIKLLDYKLNRLWHFGDISDFRIVKEPSGETFTNVLELKDFDGLSITIGIDPQIDLTELQAVLSEHINIARERIKCSSTSTAQFWATSSMGVILVGLGLLGFFLLTLVFFDARHRQKDTTYIKDGLKELKEQFSSGNPDSSQTKAFGKVAAKSYFAMYYIIKLEISQLLFLIGSIAAVAVLFGCNLILWTRSRRFYNRMRKLEIICSEMVASQNKVKI